jgi:WD40 repeat protein
MRDAHPLPELVAFLCGDGAAPLAELVALRAEADGGASEDRVRELVAGALPKAERVLASLAFFASYPLVVDTGEACEAWMGVRRAERPVVRVRGKALVPGQPAIVDAQGVPILSLWPFAQVMPPAPGAPDALFLFEGKGRRGARLVALPDPFEHEDELLWEAFGNVMRDDAAASGVMSIEEKPPFPGLAAFTASDAAMFVGRERETEAFVNRIRVTPLLAVVGPSGAGKSSFVQAGVIPALPDGWTAITVRPGPAPLVSLAAKLGGMGADASELASHPGALGTLLRTHARVSRGPIVLVVDQLEELFTLCEDADERAQYAEALARAARSADDPVRVIVTLRDDFLIEAEALAPLRTRLGPGVQLLTTPAEADLLRILTVPVRTAGYEFDDAALPGDMVAAVAHAPGALALLSFTAQKLWDLRDRRFRQLAKKAYVALGGVGGALAQHAEATLTAMPGDEQRLVREVFRHLVTADGTRAVLSRAELDEVLGGGAAAAGVVEKLVAARLLVVADDPAGERVEVTHEALLDAWPRLLGWRREDAEGARLRDQLRAAARQWDERGRPSGLLWRGDALAEYRIWRARTPGALTAAEQAFANASLADAARGRRTRTLLLGGSFVVLAVVAIALFFLNRATQRERARAEASQADAEANAQKLHDRLQAQYEAQGRRLILDGDPLQGLAYLDKAREFGAHGRAHDFLVAEAIAATEGELFEAQHGDAARTPSFSHDGTRIVTASFDQAARVWDARTGALLLTLAHKGAVMSARWSPDDATILTTSIGDGASLWDARSGTLMRGFTHTGRVYCALFSPDGRRIVSAGADGQLHVWDTATGDAIASAHGDGTGILNCAFSPDGALVAAGGADGSASVYDARNGAVRTQLRGHTRTIHMIRFSPDGARLVSASADGTAIAWEVATGRKLFAMPHHATVNSAVWSPDGKRIATSSNDHTAAVWDAATGDKLFELVGHTAGVNRAIFSPDGTRIVTMADDGVARMWGAGDGRPLARWLGHRDQITDGAFDATGARVVTASEDGRAIVWDASPQERVTELVGHDGVVECATFSPDGAHVATAGSDGTARLWDATTGRELFALRGHRGIVHWVAFAPDGRSIATAGEDATVRVWDVASGALARTIEGHTAVVNQVAWSRDGAELLSVSTDGTLRAWSAANGNPIFSVSVPGGSAMRTLTLTRDGASVVTIGDDGHVRTWDVATGEARGDRPDRDMPGSVAFDPAGARAASPIAKTLRVSNTSDGKNAVELVGHVGQVTATIAPWSPDGALIVTGGLDGTARVWDAATGDMLAVYPHGRQVWSAGFSPDGARILTSADDGTAVIRELPRLAIGGDALDRLLRCRVPFVVEGDRAVARPIDPSACERTRSAR